MQNYMSARLRLLFLFIGPFLSISHAEGLNDSLQVIWEDHTASDSSRFAAINAFYIRNSYASPDSVLSVSYMHYEMAQQKNSKREMLNALDNRALAWYVLGHNEQAMEALQQVLDILVSLNDSANLARQYANIGSIYRGQNNFLEAVNYYSLGLTILEEKGMKAAQADVLNNLGLVYEDIKQFDLAESYLNQALDLYQELGMQDKIGNIWLNMGAVHSQQSNFSEAISHGRKALPILQAENNLYSVAHTYQLFALVYQKMDQIDSALIYLHKSLAIHQDMNNKGAILNNQVMLAELTYVEDVEAATKMGEDILKKIDTLSGTRTKRDLYHLLYRCYKEQQNHRLSLEMHERYQYYVDSIQIEDNQTAITRKAIQHEFDQKLQQTEQDHAENQAQLRDKQLKERYAILLVSAVLIGLLLFYARSRTITHQKQQALLLAEIEALKHANASAALQPNGFQLDKVKIEQSIERTLNETDWKVLNLLLDDPVISNKDIAKLAFMSVDGIGSSLRRMYNAFEVKESKYKKISLLMQAIKLSNA